MYFNNKKLSTGCKELDNIINGGFSAGEVCLIFGERGSGKTTLVFQTIIKAAINGNKSLLIFTEPYVALKRLEEIAKEKWMEINERILISTIKSFQDQELLIDNLELIMEDIKIFAFDSITSYYRLALKERSNENIILNKKLNRELALIKYLTMKRNLFTILTSDITSPSGKLQYQPIAAKILTYWCDKILKIEKLLGNKRIIYLEKPYSNLSCIVRIEEEGIIDNI
ncbi:MAG: ATPase domain-containing protein [Candidatus Methanomethyliaceae archaeon]